MADSNFVIANLLGINPDGTRFDVVIHVGKPVLDDRCYACSVQLIGINDKPRRIYGEGPMQALFLGLKFVRLHLELEEERGVRFFAPGEEISGEPFDWRRFWYGDRQATPG